MPMFIGRNPERKALEDIFATDRSNLVILYGRAGMGKTALIAEFLKEKNAYYYLLRECSFREQMLCMSEELESAYPGQPLKGIDELEFYFTELDTTKLTDASYYMCASGAYPDEIAIFKMKSADDVNAVKAALDKRVESQTTTFKDYTPDEMYKIDGKNIIISGNYIALIICSDNAGATTTFNSMTK